jgi:hypothetical protein
MVLVYRPAPVRERTSAALMNIRPFKEPDRARVVELWDLCGLLAPGNDPNRDIDMKLAFQPDWLFVGEEGGRVLATVMAHAEKALFDFGCPKINLQVRAGIQEVKEFYEAIGYLFEDRYDFGKRNVCH